MSKYAYAVKVRPWGRYWSCWCPGCETWSQFGTDRLAASLSARRHAASCEALHRLNWGAACPSCKLFGRVAKACPVCLGKGFSA